MEKGQSFLTFIKIQVFGDLLRISIQVFPTYLLNDDESIFSIVNLIKTKHRPQISALHLESWLRISLILKNISFILIQF